MVGKWCWICWIFFLFKEVEKIGQNALLYKDCIPSVYNMCHLNINGWEHPVAEPGRACNCIAVSHGAAWKVACS